MSLESLKRIKERRSTEELIAAAKEADKKRDKSRKTPTIEEKAQALINHILNSENPVLEVKKEKKVVSRSSEDDWDVKIGDPIEYFDPTLSYELTGYRPINQTQGLDFDPKLFTVAARNYKETGKYTHLIPGTFSHRQYWKREFDRCRDGITIGKYTLTGENYFWLNYYRLPSVLDKSGAELQEENFPAFLAKQYEYFHYLQLCRKLGRDGVAFKARGVGASQIAASNLADAYTFHANTRNIVAAFADRYVDDTLSKVWNEFDFLNTQTEGGFRRVRMKTDTARVKVASKVDSDRNETGWKSRVEGVTIDEPRKLRGGRTYSLYFEEAGSNPKIVASYIQSRALVEINGFRVGSRFVFGTAGDTGPNLAGLKDMFYNPEEYFMLPYKHNYTKSGEYVFTGYFIPSYTMWFGSPDKPGFDSRGVVDEERAKAYYEATWSKIKDPKKLLQDKAEYCFTPEDAFILEGQNNFDQDLLLEQLHAIELHKIIEGPQYAKLHWTVSEGQANKDKRPTLEMVSQSPLQIVELPKTDEAGNPYSGLYVAGIDAIDVDQTTSTGQTDVSQFCMVIMRRSFGAQPPKIVAIYKERPQHIQTAFDNALKLCSFYNCQALVEATRISIKQYFEKEHKLHYMMRRPQATANSSKKTNFRQYGVPATEAVIQHYLELIEQFIVDYSTEIQFPDMLRELVEYSYENKRKFDIVAALGMTLLADEEMIGRVARPSQAATKKFEMAFVKNEWGQMEFKQVERKLNEPRYEWSVSGRFIVN